jgi:hypothetical protein
MTNKVKVEVEKPVFCVVEQTKITSKDRYRVVHHKNLKDGKLSIEKVEYTLVTVPEEAMKPSINGHHFREWIKVGNAAHAQQHKANQALVQETNARKVQADRAMREQEHQQARKARYDERQQGIKQARPILREQAIRKRMMDEVESGQQALPKNLRSVI